MYVCTLQEAFVPFVANLLINNNDEIGLTSVLCTSEFNQ